MQYLLMALKYLPLVLQAVQVIETDFKGATGEQKKVLVLGTVKGAVDALAPNAVSADEWKMVNQLVDSAVAVANAAGIFKKKS